MSHSPPPSVTGGVNNQAVGEGASVTYNAKAEEGKATAEATGGSEEPQLEDVTEIAALRRLIRQSEERARQREERAAEQMEQMAYMIQQQAAATERLMQGHNRTAPAAARSAADTLRSPVSVHVKRSILTERTSSAPLPFGPLQTPAAATRGTANVVEDEEDGVNARVIGVAGMTLNNILGHVGRYVKPFHADSNKDKDRTVLQFVQSIESTMGDLLIDPKSRWRLMVVKMCLQDGALDWMEQKMHDISDTAKRLGIDPQPLLVWDGEIRRAFIRQHLGTDTAELWLSKLCNGAIISAPCRASKTLSTTRSEQERTSKAKRERESSDEMTATLKRRHTVMPFQCDKAYPKVSFGCTHPTLQYEPR